MKQNFRIDDAFAQHPDNSQTAAFEVLDQWNADKTSLNQDAVPQLCGALSCIGRENLSQNVARQCNPFVLEGIVQCIKIIFLLVVESFNAVRNNLF